MGFRATDVSVIADDCRIAQEAVAVQFGVNREVVAGRKFVQHRKIEIAGRTGAVEIGEAFRLDETRELPHMARHDDSLGSCDRDNVVGNRHEALADHSAIEGLGENDVWPVRQVTPADGGRRALVDDADAVGIGR